MLPFPMNLALPSVLRIRPRMRILSESAAADESKDSPPVSIRFRHGDEKPVNATLLIPVIYKCPLPQPLSFDILTNARGCRGSAYLSPSTFASLLTFRTKSTFANPLFSIRCALFQVPYPVSPVFATHTKTAGCIPTIPILVHSERLLRRALNPSPASFVISLRPYLFASAPLPLPTTRSLQVP